MTGHIVGTEALHRQVGQKHTVYIPGNESFQQRIILFQYGIDSCPDIAPRHMLSIIMTVFAFHTAIHLVCPSIRHHVSTFQTQPPAFFRFCFSSHKAIICAKANMRHSGGKTSSARPQGANKFMNL